MDTLSTTARALDLKTKKVTEFKIVPPENSKDWHHPEITLGNEHLLIHHTLYDPATGQTVQARKGSVGIPRGMTSQTVLHEGVVYGLADLKPYDKKNPHPYRIVAYPAMGSPDQVREIARFTTEQAHLNGEQYMPRIIHVLRGKDGLIYHNGKKWVEMDWLSVDDFEQGGADD